MGAARRKKGADVIGDGRKATERGPKALLGVSRCGEGAIGLLGAPDGTQRVLAIYCKGDEVFSKELNSRGSRARRAAADWVAAVDAGEAAPVALSRPRRRKLAKAIGSIRAAMDGEPCHAADDEGYAGRRDEERKMSGSEENTGSAGGKAAPDGPRAYVIVRVADDGKAREPVMVLSDPEAARRLARLSERLIGDGASVDVVEVPFEA